jgi:oligoendopeptidase F
MQTDALLDVSKSTAEKKAVLSNLVTRSLNTLVNYAAMVMLEQRISLSILNGESMDTNTINRWYLSSLRELLESDTMKIDEHWQYGWMMESFAFYGPHYASFYQALTAALAIKRKIDNGDKKAIDLVENGIAQSSSFFSSDVLTQANIKLDESSTYQLALDELLLFSRKLNEFAN